MTRDVCVHLELVVKLLAQYPVAGKEREFTKAQINLKIKEHALISVSGSHAHDSVHNNCNNF